MWRVILGTLFAVAALVLIVAASFAWGAKTYEGLAHKDERAGLKGAAMLKASAQILHELINPTSIDTTSYVNTLMRERILHWLSSYNNTFTKGKK